ncbi:OmpA family protein [Paraflavisolibacter sp. H34]|uniref:OmpA family protein n=1 Tax=Huijunlia imazamoxiresistens TaxID=3127457 RepID=UPI0030196829
MKTLFLIIISLCFGVGNGYGQNLIANGSFEDQNVCLELSATCCPAAWFYLTHNPLGYESNYVAPSATGREHLFFIAVNRVNENRQYWQTKLLCPLQPGQRYKASVKVAGRRTEPDARDIGFYFTQDFLHSDGDTLLQPAAYLDFADARRKKLENGWFLLEKEFTAAGGEQFLLLGNFSAKKNKVILQERKVSVASILVDDVVLEPLKAGGACPEAGTVKDALYADNRRHTFPPVEVLPKTVIDTLVIGNIQFAFDSYKLKDSAILRTFQPLFANSDITKVRVVGFTDDAGSESYNQELSRKRALEIAALLKAMYGLADTLLEAEGKGISKDFEDREKNRRVEVYVFHKK